MATITTTDTIMVTARMGGHTLAELTGCGFSSIAEILAWIRRKLGSVAGMVNLRLRNSSRGWSEERRLYLSPAPVCLQLSLF